MPAAPGNSRTSLVSPASPRTGGTSPGCSNIKAAGPLAPEADVYRPMVWGSRSSAYAVSDAVQPWASSQTASQRNQRGQVRQRRCVPPICAHAGHVGHLHQGRSALVVLLGENGYDAGSTGFGSTGIAATVSGWRTGVAPAAMSCSYWAVGTRRGLPAPHGHRGRWRDIYILVADAGCPVGAGRQVSGDSGCVVCLRPRAGAGNSAQQHQVSWAPPRMRATRSTCCASPSWNSSTATSAWLSGGSALHDFPL